MHASQVSLVPGGTGQSNCTCKRLLNRLEKMEFMDGSWASFPGDLCNFWVEQLIATWDCTIPGLSSPVRKNYIIFSMKPNW